MKSSKIQERRRYFVYVLTRTLSLKAALEATSQKFGVSVPVLRVDWSRHSRWPREFFEKLDDVILEELCQQAIIRTLHQTELITGQSENPSCQLGALKLKANMLFKLRSILEEKVDKKMLIERIEKLEEWVKDREI